jgi:3-deoxy-manno-octulosonate cytidylyltransferase (CMP-KDO synthetase)
MHRAVAIIPARYESTRFAGKPLAPLRGRPIIQHVYDNVKNASLIDTVIVATDDTRIYNTVNGFEGKAVMTSSDHPSGTDRIAEVAAALECDLIINVQGDEPFVRPEMVDDVVEILKSDERVSIGTLARRITDMKDILSPDVVKVVMDNEGFALYFSRAPVPFYRDAWGFEDGCITGSLKTGAPASGPLDRRWYKHVGIYGYRKDVLLRFTAMEQGGLEMVEKLEQLRALSSGIRIKVRETGFDTFGIDTEEDLKRGEEWLNSYS